MKKHLLNGLPWSCKDIITLAGTLGVTFHNPKLGFRTQNLGFEMQVYLLTTH